MDMKLFGSQDQSNIVFLKSHIMDAQQNRDCFGLNIERTQSWAHDNFLASQQQQQRNNVIEPRGPGKRVKIFRYWCLPGPLFLSIIYFFQMSVCWLWISLLAGTCTVNALMLSHCQ